MPKKVTTQRIYLNKNDEAFVVCPNCEKTKTKNFANYKKSHITIKIKCSCNCIFKVIVETRDFYRKGTYLYGFYKSKESKESGGIIIEDLSLTGICFRTKLRNNIREEETLEISFTLNNKIKSTICKIAIVKRIEDRLIGAEFCDLKAFEKELGFYLMPS